MRKYKKREFIVDSYPVIENGKTYICYVMQRADGTEFRAKTHFVNYTFDDNRLSSIEGLTRRFEGGMRHAISSLAKSLDDPYMSQRYVNQAYDQVQSFVTKATTTKKIVPPEDMQGFVNNMFQNCISDIILNKENVDLESTFDRVLSDEKAQTNQYLVNAIASVCQPEKVADDVEAELE